MRAIPDELRAVPQWVIWRREERDDKTTKVPYQARRPSVPASTTSRATWATCEEACRIALLPGVDGIGFVFAENDPYCGIDFDDCVTDGTINAAVRAEIEKLGSYTEISQSGKGVHVIVLAVLDGGRNRTKTTPWGGGLEIYDHGRYFALTGNAIAGLQVADGQAAVDDLRARVLSANGNGKPAAEPRSGENPPPSGENSPPDPAPATRAARDPAGLLKRYPRLGKIARRELDEPPGDGSASGWDYHLACEAQRRVKDPKATVAELEALVRHARAIHGEEKGLRDDYIRRTVAKAIERESGPPEAAGAADLIGWVSGQWHVESSDPIVAWRAIGHGSAAVIRLKRRSGAVVRLRRLGDLYDPARHVEEVSTEVPCRCPVLDKQTAVRIAQALGEACGVRGDPDAERAEVDDELTRFAAELGHETAGELDDWATLVESVDYVPMEKTSTGIGKEEFRPKRGPLTPAQRACGIRDGARRLWLPAGALGDHLAAHNIKVVGGRLRPLLEEAGWEYRRVELREPADERGPGVTRDDGRHLKRVFYGSPSTPSTPQSARAVHIAQEEER